MKEIYTYKKNNKGFTLVEMIVVLAILVILLSTSVMGLLAWQDWADFNRENEYAQSLFIAAQNQLCVYPALNLVSNIGNDDEATHTSFSDITIKSRELEFPLVAPSIVGSCQYSDKLMVGGKSMAKIYGFDRVEGLVETRNLILN